MNFQKIYNKLSKKLLNYKWLEKENISFDLIDEHIKSELFKENLKAMLETKDYSCKNALFICRNIMEDVSNSEAPENWLNYIYEYTLNKSFPEAVNITLKDSLNSACELYLKVLRIICEAQKDSRDNTWQSMYPMIFLTEEEKLERPEEYRKFLKAFKDDCIYEMMKLNGEVYNYNTLDHICGVHFLALFIAKQAKAKGIPIDLGRISGAAAGHDIGKYGCKSSELKRVPYLHYYYTDQWFKKNDINYIRNIALNHSTWDLEFENLSIESLILIYSDFRVKNKSYGNKVEMHIFTLEDSFQVILDKLDNVDEAKEKRYKKVYGKLKDFEDFLKNLCIETDPSNTTNTTDFMKTIEKNYSLMQGEEIIQNIKYLAIDHNINLMYQLRDEYSLDALLDRARSEKNWKNLREYIRILEEYSTYLTQNQKLQTIRFLYENLIHAEDDIRRHCAELMGIIIAFFDEDYRKEIPENVILDSPSVTSNELLDEYMNLLLNPGYKTISIHRFYLGYSISIMTASLFKFCQKKSIAQYTTTITKYYNEKLIKNLDSQVFLLETIKHIPLNSCDENTNIITNFVLHMLRKHNSYTKLCSLEAAFMLISKLPHNYSFRSELTDYMLYNIKKSSMPSENTLKYSIAKALNLEELKLSFKHYCELDEKKMSQLFLSNLKTATDWIKKKSQINLLLQYALKSVQTNGLHTAIHFCNLLKVSAVEKVRNAAGESILKLMPELSLSERNEVSIELLRALEIEGNRFTEYIPYYTGQVILWLQPVELDEIVEDLRIKIKRSSSNIKALILKTIGVALSNYSEYKTRFKEDTEAYNNRQLLMLGVLLNGLGDYNLSVKQASFSVIGKDLFGTKKLTLEEKKTIFAHIGKKILTMISDIKNEELLILTNSAALNHIYRFLSEYSFIIGRLDMAIPENIAFFPGAFDPFSLSHKEIAKHIRDMGFEVFLAVDEFSWSKKTLPNMLRRDIVNMSIGDEAGIFIYPKNMPVNISNPEDLKALKENFRNSNVYMAIGSDVILNASAYKLPKGENTIHNFNHIIFERGKNKKLEEAVKKISGNVKFLSLPSKYYDISSTQIRTHIDENRDISSLIDPLAQQFIYDNGFYQREPQDKSFINSVTLKVETIEYFKKDIADNIINTFSLNKGSFLPIIRDVLNKPSGKLILLRDTLNNNEITAFSLLSGVSSDMLYKELKDTILCSYIRSKSSGRNIIVHCFMTKPTEKLKSFEQILLTETLAYCIAKDFQYAIFKNSVDMKLTDSMFELLELHGFSVAESSDANSRCLTVDISSPCILNLDIENVLKEPFGNNAKVRNVILSCRKLLQNALTKLYPGKLVLSINSNALHQSLIRKICEENGVPIEASPSRKLGESMCVPYGDILDRYIIPNTVTKALHTEKYFRPSLKDFKIAELPHYLDLKTQVKAIKSFKRPVILVDNILHKGYRMKALDPLLRKEDVNVKKIICGILSGRGKDLMDMQNREVDSVYFIPKLNLWFNESTLYPFIGGDAIWRGSFPQRNLIPSINLILPYTSPNFIRGASLKSIYDLSKVCMENSLKIMYCLESEYHEVQEKNLNILNLGEVFTVPRCPDKGKSMDYDLGLNPSHYIKNDLEQLMRFESIFDNFSERS